MAATRPDAVPETRLLGVRLALVDVAEAAARIAARPPDAPFAYVVTPNAQHMVTLERGRNPAFAAAYAAAWMRTCDSQVMRRLAKLFYGMELKPCAGSDLTAALFARHIRPEDAVTVIGGDETLAARLRAQFGLARLAWHAPPMGFDRMPAEVERCVDFVVAHPARYVFFAVGAPRSEILAHRILETGRASGVGLCIGSSLHFVTGLVRRAPRIFQALGLEWSWRLLLAPRTHARRVFVESLPLVGIMWRARRDPARPPSGRG